MGIQNPKLYFPQMALWTTKVHFRCFWTNLDIFFSLTWKFDGVSKSAIVLSPHDCLDHKSPISLFLDRFEYFFSLTWKFDGDSKSDIVLSPNDCLDHVSQISLFMDRFQWFFLFELEIWWGFQIRYCTFLKWLSGLQKSNFELRSYECCHSCYILV